MALHLLREGSALSMAPFILVVLSVQIYSLRVKLNVLLHGLFRV